MRLITYVLLSLFLVGCGATLLEYNSTKLEPNEAMKLLEKSLRMQPGKYKTYETQVTNEFFVSSRAKTGTSFWTGQKITMPGVDHVYYKDIKTVLLFDKGGLYIVKLQDGNNQDLYSYVTKNITYAHEFINALESLR